MAPADAPLTSSVVLSPICSGPVYSSQLQLAEDSAAGSSSSGTTGSPLGSHAGSTEAPVATMAYVMRWPGTPGLIATSTGPMKAPPVQLMVGRRWELCSPLIEMVLLPRNFRIGKQNSSKAGRSAAITRPDTPLEISVVIHAR